MFSEIEQQRWEGNISLATFYQLLYFIDKKLNNPREAAQRAYACLRLTPFNPSLLSDLDIDLWPDYADGLQYVCAQSGKCNTIIYTNIADFSLLNYRSSIPLILYCGTVRNSLSCKSGSSCS